MPLTKVKQCNTLVCRILECPLHHAADGLTPTGEGTVLRPHMSQQQTRIPCLEGLEVGDVGCDCGGGLLGDGVEVDIAVLCGRCV